MVFEYRAITMLPCYHASINCDFSYNLFMCLPYLVSDAFIIVYVVLCFKGQLYIKKNTVLCNA